MLLNFNFNTKNKLLQKRSPYLIKLSTQILAMMQRMKSLNTNAEQVISLAVVLITTTTEIKVTTPTKLFILICQKAELNLSGLKEQFTTRIITQWLCC